MVNLLQNLYNDGSYGLSGLNSVGNANSTPSMIGGQKLDEETLPYNGGIFNVSGDSAIAPAPVFTGGATTPQAPQVPEPVANNLNNKYKDPKTGEIMSPQEYANYMVSKLPKGTGQIPNYAGDAMTNPNQTSAELTGRATDLNNARNDIATGTTDPYGVASKSGIAYSPTQLKAIENAYAGIYDPALNDVFSRLQEKKTAEAKKASREDKIFATNESIRQWQATTGTKKNGGDSNTPKSIFTQTQLNNGASNSGLGLDAFSSLDDDIKNFYINTPMALNDEDKKVPIYQNFEEDFDRIIAGELKADELSDDIMGSTLPQSVKHYFIEQIPASPEKKEGWFSKVWGAITGK